MDNDVVEDGCLVPVVDGVYNGVVVGGYVLPVKKDAVVWTVVVVVFAGVVEDNFLDVKDMFAAVVLSAGVVTVKQDAFVCTIFVVVLAGVVEMVLLGNDTMSEADDKLDVDVLDVIVVGPVVDPIVVDDVVVHVAHIAVDTRPFCVIKVVSLGGNDIGSEVMFLCSIKTHDTFTIRCILKGVNIKDRIRYKKSV